MDAKSIGLSSVGIENPIPAVDVSSVPAEGRSSPPRLGKQRNLGLDAYRGLIMILLDGLHLRRPMFFLTVVGMNSLFVYCVGEILRGWINSAVMVFTGGFRFIGTLAPLAQSCAVLLVIWSLTYWLYKRNIFLRPSFLTILMKFVVGAPPGQPRRGEIS